jgi:hypothetical protein
MIWSKVKNDLRQGLAAPKPDYYECLSWKEYPAEALKALGTNLQPTKFDDAMPGFV